MHIPKFADLPVMPEAPPGSSWGVFGREDRLGTLNFLTDDRRLAAARPVHSGRTFNLDLPLNLPSPPMFASRTAYQHTVLHRPGTFGRDDRLDGFYLQGSSQWDALKHISHPEFGFYNWLDDARVDAEPRQLGIQNFAAQGIVGRGVLLDTARHFEALGRPLAPDAHREISVEELEQVAREQGVEFQPGDIVMLRTGVARLLYAEAERPASAVRPYPGGPGLAASTESLAWLWDHQVAAIVSDNLTVEAYPMAQESLHRRGIPLLGLVLGELFDLESLADDCAADGRFECMFVGKPLNLPGGVGSPANAIAIK